jgi:hypothetical protein
MMRMLATVDLGSLRDKDDATSMQVLAARELQKWK